MSSPSDTAVGFVLCIVSALGFGSMFVPVKPYDLGDGFFVTLVQSMAIMVCGMIVWLAQGMPPFSNYAFFAGAILATGNIITIPVVNMVGMGLGIMIWGSVQIIVGWATGRYGWFGLSAQIPSNNAMQYTGVALTLVSAVMFALVKYSKPEEKQPDTLEMVPKEKPDEHKEKQVAPPAENGSSDWATKIFAVCLGIFGGVCFGEMITPITLAEETISGASQNGLDYAFSFGIGVMTCASLFFFMYCIVKGNKPYVNAQLILPGTAYGVLWSIAYFSWLVSATKISSSITFPINTRLPGIVASLWGVLYFGEIRGVYNLLVLVAAIVVAVVGVVLVGVSG